MLITTVLILQISKILTFENLKTPNSLKNETLYTSCGFESDTNFYNWFKSIKTNTPVLYPQDDLELQLILQTAKKNNCVIRPVGATHSAGGLVMESNEENLVGVSLAFYNPSSGPWLDKLNKISTTEDGEKIIHIAAGRSILDLVEIIRPEGYYTKTQTAGFIFQLGGIFSNTVHGGFYGRSFFNNYVNSLRVMLHDGSIRIINNPEEMKYWRQSFGLLGIITAMEIQLERRDNLLIESDKFNLKGKFTKETLDIQMNKMKNGSIYGEFFYRAYGDEFMNVRFSNHIKYSNCNYEPLAKCNPVENCYFSLFNLPSNGLCHIKDSKFFVEQYTKYHKRFPDIATKGAAQGKAGNKYHSIINILLAISRHVDSIKHSNILSKLLSEMTFYSIELYVSMSRRESADGYWLRETPNANIMAYFFPADKLYDALLTYRTLVLELAEERSILNKFTSFKFNQPCEYRYVNLSRNYSIAQIPDKEGEFIVIEAIHLVDGEHDFNWGFAHLEYLWKQIEGATPHIGKIWGYDYQPETLNEIKEVPRPFVHDKARGLLSKDQIEKFESYRNLIDPNGLFEGGLGIQLFRRRIIKN